MNAIKKGFWLKLTLPALLASMLLSALGGLLNVHAAPLFSQGLSLSPTSGPAGSTVWLSGIGFTPGPATALWDGVPQVSFTISSGGVFYKGITVPTGATPGGHTVSACGGSPCNSGEFAESASAGFTVTGESATPTGKAAATGYADYQIIALEVTQAVRGDIPERIPTGSLTLPADDALHVANRRTVVRAYPYVYLLPGGYVRPVTAYLQYKRGDSWSAPIYPETRYRRVEPSWNLTQMRKSASLSFNFILPAEAYQAGTTDIRVVINPEDRDHILECPGCGDNNTTRLNGVGFRNVQSQDIDLRVYIADFAYRNNSGEMVHFMPSTPQLSQTINYWIKVWPVDPSRIRVSYHYTRISQNPPPYSDTQPRQVSPPIPGYPQWDNQVYLDENTDILVPHILLRPPYSFIWLAFDNNSWMGCGGQAGIGNTPLFHAATCGPTLAQEALHSISVNHAGNSHGEDAGGGHNPDYPGEHGQVEDNAYGFDVWEMRAVPPDIGGNTHDFMSYGWTSSANAWVSIYTWEQIAGLFGATDINVGTSLIAARIQSPALLPAAQGRSAYLRIAGDIVDGSTIYLSPVFTVEAPGGSGDGAGQGSYTMYLQDASGATLFQRAFEPYAITEEGLSSFYELVPLVDGLARVVISRDGQSIGALSASLSPPQVTLLSPAPGDHWAADGDQAVTWQGSDPDGDVLTYRVQASADGQTWETLSGATTDTQALIHLAYVPGSGQNWRVRVQASDGLHVTSAEAQGISIDAKPPIPLIVNPLDREFFDTSHTVEVLGQAYDYAEGAIPGESLEWLVDGAVLAKGETASLSGLKAGEHTLGLRATNSAGLQGTTEIKITLGQDLDRDGLPDDWEKQVGLDANDPKDAIADKDGDGTLNWQEYQLGSDPSDPGSPSAKPHEADNVGPSGSVLQQTADLPAATATTGDQSSGPTETPLVGQTNPTDQQPPADPSSPLSNIPLLTVVLGLAALVLVLGIVVLVLIVFLRRGRRPQK